jgi:hypothetical protein
VLENKLLFPAARAGQRRFADTLPDSFVGTAVGQHLRGRRRCVRADSTRLDFYFWLLRREESSMKSPSKTRCIAASFAAALALSSCASSVSVREFRIEFRAAAHPAPKPKAQPKAPPAKKRVFNRLE